MNSSILFAITILGVLAFAFGSASEPATVGQPDPAAEAQPGASAPPRIVYVPVSPQPVLHAESDMNEFDRAAWDKLMETVDKLELRETPLQEALNQLAHPRELNLLVNWQGLEALGIRADDPVTLSLHKVRLATALQAILDAASGENQLKFYLQDGIVRVVEQLRIVSEVCYTEVYDCAGLIDATAVTEARRLILQELRDRLHNQPAAQGQVDAGVLDTGLRECERILDQMSRESWDTTLEELAEVIRSSVQPETWRDEGGTLGTIAPFRGKLVVTQNVVGHYEIKQLLDRLRTRGR